MPSASSAAAAAGSPGGSGRSNSTVARTPRPSRPMSAPPKPTWSGSVSSRASTFAPLPVPSTKSRSKPSPSGARISTALPFLPLKLATAAARSNRPTLLPTISRVFGDSARSSAAKATSTEGAASGPACGRKPSNGTNSIATEEDIPLIPPWGLSRPPGEGSSCTIARPRHGQMTACRRAPPPALKRPSALL